MVMRTLLSSLLIAGVSLGSTVSSSLPDYDGPYATSGFPIDLGTIGNFTYVLPAGSVVTAATFSGKFGTAAVPSSTAGFDAVVDGAHIVGVCPPYAAGCWEVGADFRPFSVAVPGSAFSSLLDGTASLRIIQTNEFNVRLGSPTLTIEYTATPEPGTLGMVAFAGVMLAARRWRRRQA
jgi:hypothetical protein